MSSVRQWVYQALVEVIRHGQYSNLYLKKHLQEVDEKDRNLATNIFYGTLQNYALCQHAWRRFTDDKVEAKTGILLTMSCYQLLFLKKVPAYAVIDEANRIAARSLKGQRGLVNAVLRKVKDHPVEYPGDPIESLALSTSLPAWLIRLWVKQYGPKQAFQFAKAANMTLPVVVRVNPLRYSIEEAMKCPRLKARADSEKTGLFEYTGSQFGSDWLYREGKVSAQDPGSYEIARWADVKPGQSVLDLCAAPGTKTMAMAEMSGDGAEITPQDLHEHRVQLIENDAKRLGLEHVIARQADSTKVDEPPKLYDVVLCDVPCSGLGILSRKPDLKLKLDPANIDSLLPIQKELLNAAGKQTRPGGILIYSTCTLDKKENEKQVDAFLQTHPDFERVQEETIEPSAQNGGFYLCKLVRKEKAATTNSETLQA